MKNKSTLVLGLVSITVVGVVVGLSLTSDPLGFRTHKKTVSNAQVFEALNFPGRFYSVGAPYRWNQASRVLGERYLYDASYEAAMEVYADGRAVGTQSLKLTGQVYMAAVDNGESDDSIVRLRFESLALSGNAVTGAQRVEIREQLKVPFYVAIKSNGAIRDLYFHKSVAYHSRIWLRGFAVQLQFVQPKGTESLKAWDTEEVDEMGRYKAHYVSEGVTYQKTKPEYLVLHEHEDSAQRGLKVAMKVTFNAFFRFQSDGWPLEVSYEQQSVHPKQDELVPEMRSAVKGRINLVRKEKDLAEAKPFSDLKEQYLGDGIIDTRGRDLHRKWVQRDATNRLAKAAGSVTDLLKEYVTSDANEDENADKIALRVLRKLSAKMTVDPQVLAEVRELLFSGNLTIKERYMLTSAIGATDTKEAHALLIDLVAAYYKVKDEGLDDAISMLAVTAQGSMKAVDTLKPIAENSEIQEKYGARLAIGVQTGILLKNKESGAEDVVDYLVQQFERSSDVHDLNTYSAALGNSGHVKTFRTADLMMQSASAEVRAQGLYSLRFIDDPRVDEYMAKYMFSDRSPEVRAKAIKVYQYRSMDPIVADMIKAAKSDSSGVVRKAALGMLGTEIDRYPTIEPLVRWLALNDQNEEVRRRAQKLMTTYLAYKENPSAGWNPTPKKEN